MQTHVHDAHCSTPSHTHSRAWTVLTTGALKENEHTSALIMFTVGGPTGLTKHCFFFIKVCSQEHSCGFSCYVICKIWLLWQVCEGEGGEEVRQTIEVDKWNSSKCCS